MKRSMKVSLAVAAVSMISLGSLAVAGAGAASAATRGAAKPALKHTKLQAKLDWTPARTPAEIKALRNAPLTGSTVKTFTATVTDGSSFSYTMVGKNPAVHVKNPVTNVPTTIIPVIIKYNGLTYDPTAVTSCDTESAMARTNASPLFNAQSWTFGAKSVGSHQYEDAFQRAEFYKYSKPSGTNPTFNVNLVTTVHAPLTLNVPSGDWAEEYSDSCGNGVLGEIDVNYLDSQLQSYISGTLGSTASTTFPLFVTNNVVEDENGNPTDCCILGFHNAMTNAGHFQFYGIADYDNSGDFGTTEDTAGMSHEIAEAINDPNTGNPTKPWGHIGQVSGCQSNLEVGDPLSGTVITRIRSGFTYHLQELAFFSWFYHQSPSIGVNGWYSSEGTFTSSAAACS